MPQFTDTLPSEAEVSSSVSVVLLLAGIISSRAGLYIADLTVHQIFQQVSCLATVKHLSIDFVRYVFINLWIKVSQFNLY